VSALPDRLYRTVGTGTFNPATSLAAFSQSPYVANGINYGSNFSFNAATGVTTEAAATTLVNSPIATACFSCHDSSLAQAHITTNGGSIYAPRSSALVTGEQCLLCHGSGKVADIKEMHAK
jgi:OmcA/MtrC family decaheme c-type cytochrome